MFQYGTQPSDERILSYSSHHANNDDRSSYYSKGKFLVESSASFFYKQHFYKQHWPEICLF